MRLAPTSMQPLGYQQFTSLASAQSLTVPTGAEVASIACTMTAGGYVRFRDDGTAPTAAIGETLPTGQAPLLYQGDLTKVQFILGSGTLTSLDVGYYGWGQPAPSAWTLLSSVSAALGAAGGTTSAINTVGADLIVVCFSASNVSGTLSDSPGNAYTLASSAANGGDTSAIRIRFVHNPIVSASHTFTITGASSFASISAMAFSGSANGAVLDSVGANIGSGSSLTSQSCGAVSPVNNNELVIYAAELGSANGQTGFSASLGTLVASLPSVTSVEFGLLSAYYLQSTAATVIPRFSWTNVASATGAAATFIRKP